MQNRFWTFAERAGWLAGVLGVLWALFVYFVPSVDNNPVPGEGPSAPVNEVHERGAEPVIPSGRVGNASQTPPESSPTESKDRIAVAAAFGDLFDLKGSSKHIAPHTADNSTFIKRVHKLVVAGDSLVWSLWEMEQDASEPWVTVAEPTYPNPGAMNPRLSTKNYSCRAPIRELNAPKAFYEQILLSCAVGECWQCSGTVEHSFGVPTQILDKPHREIQTHPNKTADIRAVVEAIGRLQTPGSAYKN